MAHFLNSLIFFVLYFEENYEYEKKIQVIFTALSAAVKLT